jgi:hypothetical protein
MRKNDRAKPTRIVFDLDLDVVRAGRRFGASHLDSALGDQIVDTWGQIDWGLLQIDHLDRERIDHCSGVGFA